MTATANPNPHPFTIDGHEDAVFYARAHGGPARFDAGWEGAQLDRPGLIAGEIDAAFWAIFTPGEEAAAHDAAAATAQVDEMLAAYRAWIDGAPDFYRLVQTKADLRAVVAAAADPVTPAPLGVVLHCEGARGIAGIDHLQKLHAQGLRSVGLTWNGANAYATGALGDPETGLTPAGKDLVRELNRLHMMIDASHLNRRGLWDLLEISSQPVVVTHTACARFLPHPRNLQDDQIKAVAEHGGLIGVFFVNVFLAPEGTPVTLDTLLEHYDHLLDLAGPDHLALGTDYGGVGSGLPPGVETAGKLSHLFAAFAAHGYPPATVEAIRGGNYLRLLSDLWA